MGTTWNTRPQTKEQFVHEIVTSFGNKTLLLAMYLRGNNFWVLIKPEEGDNEIGLFRLYSKDGCWGYKDMSESCGPLYYDCPLSFLDRAPEPNGFNKNLLDSGRSWRDFVRDYHNDIKQRTKLKVGDRIKLNIPGYDSVYLVTKSLGRKGFLLNDFLRLNCRQVKYATIVH
jgi:hypothetical protein